jgi:hypothetical protein
MGTIIVWAACCRCCCCNLFDYFPSWLSSRNESDITPAIFLWPNVRATPFGRIDPERLLALTTTCLVLPVRKGPMFYCSFLLDIERRRARHPRHIFRFQNCSFVPQAGSIISAEVLREFDFFCIWTTIFCARAPVGYF